MNHDSGQYRSVNSTGTVATRDAGEQENDGGIAPCPFKRGQRGGGAFFIAVSWVISCFIKIGLKQIYCSYSRNKKILSVLLLLFSRSILLLNWYELFVFYTFPLLSTFLLPSCSFGVPGCNHSKYFARFNK